jgi:hypothetical protein
VILEEKTVMAKGKSSTKNGGRHTTLVDAAKPLADFARKQPEVTKISPGIIKPGIRGGQQRCKFKEIQGGILATVRGSTSIQEVYIYSSSPKFTLGKISEFCEKHFGR